MNGNVEKFLEELHALLDKYDATIHVGYGEYSDMHGVYDQHISVSIGRETVHRIDDWYLDRSNLL